MSGPNYTTTEGREVTMVEPGSIGWGRAWDALRAYIVHRRLGDGRDIAQEHAESGEAWQYMCHVGGRAQFRHRMHPMLGRRLDVTLEVGS